MFDSQNKNKKIPKLDTFRKTNFPDLSYIKKNTLLFKLYYSMQMIRRQFKDGEDIVSKPVARMFML